MLIHPLERAGRNGVIVVQMEFSRGDGSALVANLDEISFHCEFFWVA